MYEPKSVEFRTILSERNIQIRNLTIQFLKQ